MRPTLRTIVFALIPTLVVVGLLGLGFLAGRHSVIRSFGSQIRVQLKVETLGQLLSAERKRRAASAYHDPEAVVDQLGGFSWVVPNVPTPFVGGGPRPGRHANSHINSMQFRADDPITVPKPPQTYRVFLTGGSTAFGSGASSQQRTIAGYLEQMMNSAARRPEKLRFEVLTMANPGWATTHERIIIENRLSELDPDMVISLSGINDVHWAIRGRNVLWFRSYADELFFGLIDTAYQMSGYGALPEVAEVASEPVSPPLVAERLAKNVELSAHALSLSDAAYVFALQPTLATIREPFVKPEDWQSQPQQWDHVEYFRECYRLIDGKLSLIDVPNFHYIDLSGMSKRMSHGDELFIDSYHFGDRGNELVAREIFARIEHLLVPGSSPGL